MHLDWSTRERILESAGELFATVGFRSATVRRICEKAGVNISSIKDYFGSKEKLYKEVLGHWTEFATEKYPILLDVGEDAPPEDQLRAFIRSLLFRLLDKGKPAWFGRLMARETAEPTRAFDGMFKNIIRQRREVLASILRKLMGAHISEEIVRFFCMSILSQCFYYYNSRLTTILFERDMSSPGEVERIADHIMRFSLKGLEGYFKLTKVTGKVSRVAKGGSQT